MDIDEEFNLTPSEVAETANEISSLLPEKRRVLYEKTYAEFIAWCDERKIIRYSKSVLLTYFSNIAEKGLIASLWPKYAMLKSTLSLKSNIDISKYNKLIMFIKKKRTGYVPKKSKTLEKEQAQKFISDAPNDVFLMIKVALIFRVAGALRKDELLKLETNNVQDLGSKFLVTIKASKTHK
uniref:Uncharacterized protein LOC114344094 n=1 Tax=Diabrotica virgifera virgifera TaxID=50390 RepID=A0A6P7GM76_DIAVI